MPHPSLRLRSTLARSVGCMEPQSAIASSSASAKRKRRGQSAKAPDNESAVTGGQQRQRRMACRECRQRKIRCDVSTDGTGTPCSRCQHYGTDCLIDTAYKRVNKRDKVDELEAQLRELRSAVANKAYTDNDFTSGEPALPPNGAMMNSLPSPFVGDEITIDISSPTVQSAPRNNYYIDELSDPPINSSMTKPVLTISRSLDSVHLTGQEIEMLFQVYFSKFHPSFEILNPKLSPEAYYNTSPVLFWTIIYVASRHYEDIPGLFTSLWPSLSRLLWSEISSPPHTQHMISAILLTCIWPFPTSSMSQDSAFVMCGIAKHAAMQLGLHKPEFVQDFSRTRCNPSPRDVSQAVTLWAGCFIVAYSTTSTVGYEQIFSSDRTISYACGSVNPYSLPRGLYENLVIHNFCNRFQRALTDDAGNMTESHEKNESLLILKLFEQGVLEVETQLGDMTSINKIIWLSAKTQLRALYFFENIPTEFRQQGLLKAYSSASTLIRQVAEANKNNQFIKSTPSYLIRILMMAGIIILRMHHSTYSNLLAAEDGKADFNTAVSLLRQASIEDNDQAGRGSKIIVQLWSAYSSTARQIQREPRLKLQTRLGASILHDSLWEWREKFGNQSAVYQTPSDSTISDATDLQLQGTSPSSKFTQTAGPIFDDTLDPNMFLDLGLPSYFWSI